MSETSESFHESQITRAIAESYHRKLSECIESDVIIIGAGPSGLVAAAMLAKAGRKVVVLEKRLAPGGGVWGGAAGMNNVVVQAEAWPILDHTGVRYTKINNDIASADAAELACALCLKALQAGVIYLNLMAVEDLCAQDGRMTGVVVNRTLLGESLPIDPICIMAPVVIDATGHDAVSVRLLRQRMIDLPEAKASREGMMHASAGERFVVEHTGEIFPGLWVSGMAVCAAYGGPRMGPIFGGMLLSGQRVARMIMESGTRPSRQQ